MKITDLIEKYIESARKSGKKKQTLTKYRSRLLYFVAHFDPARNLVLADISDSHLHQFQRYLQQEPIQPESKHLYLTTLKQFFLFLYEQHYYFVDYSPVIVWPELKQRKRKKWSIEAAQRVLASRTDSNDYAARDSAIVALYLIEELTSTQIRKLTILDLDLEAKEIRLREKERFKKLNPVTMKYLRRYLSSRVSLQPRSDYLVIAKNRCQMPLRSIQKITRNLKQNER